MKAVHIFTGIACVSVVLAAGAIAGMPGVQPVIADVPAGYVPLENIRNTPKEESFRFGGAVLVGEDLKKKEMDKSKKASKRKPRKTAGSSEAPNDGPKEDPRMFQQQSSDESVQGQQLINEQHMKQQQPANRPASERGGSSK
jgi:hypothetical protein